MKSWKICVFLDMTRFLQKNGGLNRWAITGVLLKTRVKNVIKKDTTENKKKQESINKSSKKWRFEN